MVTIYSNSTSAGAKEADVQKACWSWLKDVLVKTPVGDEVWLVSLQDYAYMVPNGTQLAGVRQRRAQYMASLKAQGFKPGVSDIVIAFPNGGYCGAYIELKRSVKVYKGPAGIKNAIRAEQREWLERMAAVGYWASVAYGLDDFKLQVNSYLMSETPPPLDWADRLEHTQS